MMGRRRWQILALMVMSLVGVAFGMWLFRAGFTILGCLLFCQRIASELALPFVSYRAISTPSVACLPFAIASAIMSSRCNRAGISDGLGKDNKMYFSASRK
jgi:hypothetical protein